MPRSSGQKAMPARAIASDGSADQSRGLRNSTEPLRCSTMPMIDFSVVVLPTPLRPEQRHHLARLHVEVHAVQNVRLAIPGFERLDGEHGARCGDLSGMAGPQIGLAHRRIGRHRLVVAFGQ